jgi:hypothetical protein
MFNATQQLPTHPELNAQQLPTHPEFNAQQTLDIFN